MWMFFTGLALAANPYEGVNADVVASRYLNADASTIYDVLLDLETSLALIPCADEPIVTNDFRGEGGAFQTTYVLGWMNRVLQGKVSSALEDQVIDWDHAGERGFVTRWKLEVEGAGTRVTLTTYLSGPPFPLRRYFYKRIHPKWTICHQEALQALAATVE